MKMILKILAVFERDESVIDRKRRRKKNVNVTIRVNNVIHSITPLQLYSCFMDRVSGPTGHFH